MKYSKSVLLYEDEAASGWILRFILIIIPALFFVLSVYFWYSGEGSDSLVLLAEGVFVSLLLWAILPRKYQVFTDHLAIVLGGPLKVKIVFNQISKIEVTARTGLTINLVSSVTRSYVIIVKKKGLSIAITPRNNDLFVENANIALSQWGKRSNI